MSTKEQLTEILDFLNDTKMRATYGAVAGYLGVKPRGMGQLLGEHSLRNSWVVNEKKDVPTDYPPELIHPELHRLSLRIDTADKLNRGLQRWRQI